MRYTFACLVGLVVGVAWLALVFIAFIGLGTTHTISVARCNKNVQ